MVSSEKTPGDEQQTSVQLEQYLRSDSSFQSKFCLSSEADYQIVNESHDLSSVTNGHSSRIFVEGFISPVDWFTLRRILQ